MRTKKTESGRSRGAFENFSATAGDYSDFHGLSGENTEDPVWCVSMSWDC